ncbi:hypothetical protein [Mycolicibacterium komossense]|uniref:Integral membrane protein n=1 Tax=Mycolicibacterium komossense TaxID=1779 RepID=A0ABT3CIX3_9MYCO|nr:hypothetical protein [Mycolicibacterium komossense]MCV7229440.1 hypothetical protein [Mycolicibacterium komossense]
MIATSLLHPRVYGLTLTALALVCVFVGTRYTAAAVAAVALTAAGIVLDLPSPMCTVLSGLAATGYLVALLAPASSLHARAVALLFAVSFGVVGVFVSMPELDVTWLPLLAPLGMLAAFAATVAPYLSTKNKD